jgi:hypothetical protein
MEHINGYKSSKIINRHIKKMEDKVKCYLVFCAEYNIIEIRLMTKGRKALNRFKNNLGIRVFQNLANSLTATGQGKVTYVILMGDS